MTEITEARLDDKVDIAELMANDVFDGTCQAAHRTTIFDCDDLDGNAEVYETFYKPLCQTQMDHVFVKVPHLFFALNSLRVLAGPWQWTVLQNFSAKSEKGWACRLIGRCQICSC